MDNQCIFAYVEHDCSLCLGLLALTLRDLDSVADFRIMQVRPVDQTGYQCPMQASEFNWHLHGQPAPPASFAHSLGSFISRTFSDYGSTFVIIAFVRIMESTLENPFWKRVSTHARRAGTHKNTSLYMCDMCTC